MARSKLTDIKQDIITDEGSILLSFVKGEQIELAIPIEFINSATDGYTFEAVIVEAANEVGQTSPPKDILEDGVQNTLNVRLPNIVGAWQPNTEYFQENIVFNNNKWWRLRAPQLTANIEPQFDSRWAETQLNIIYVQFPSTIASNWTIKPQVEHPVYGFFEIRVTEPNNPIFVRTWKPVRGMIEILFSPTHIVPDVE
jgi:hypothetical protein